jgi:hypothetical protein
MDMGNVKINGNNGFLLMIGNGRLAFSRRFPYPPANELLQKTEKWPILPVQQIWGQWRARLTCRAVGVGHVAKDYSYGAPRHGNGRASWGIQ